MSSLGTFLIALGIAGAAVIFVLGPLRHQGGRREKGRRYRNNIDQQRLYADLVAERNALYNALLELDFDYSVDKVAEEDYARQRYDLTAEAVEVLKELDALAAATRTDDSVEAAVRAYRDRQSMAERTELDDGGAFHAAK